MFYVVYEVQQNANDVVSVIPTTKTDWSEALSTYYSICASAAISSIPYHSAYIVGDDGSMRMCQVFDRRAVV